MKRSALYFTLFAFAISMWPLQPAAQGEALSASAVTDNGAQQSTAAPADAQGVLAQAEALLKQARETGASYANNKDEPSKKATRKAIEEAEKLMKEALKRDPACENAPSTWPAPISIRATSALRKIMTTVSRWRRRG